MAARLTHPHAPAARQAGSGFSLLLLSAGHRLAGASVLLALLWGSVIWALA